jgi:hypothetical protein
MTERWGFSIDKWIYDGAGEIVGLIATSDNGESQYLSWEEYTVIIKNNIINKLIDDEK